MLWRILCGYRGCCCVACPWGVPLIAPSNFLVPPTFMFAAAVAEAGLRPSRLARRGGTQDSAAESREYGHPGLSWCSSSAD